jgi:shikimate dehydrogenase
MWLPPVPPASSANAMVSGNTRVAGVIGQPIRHSMSPAIHNAAYREVGLDWLYVAFEVAPRDLASALRSVSALGLGGLSVTMPHKADVAILVDEPSATVRALAACNTVVPLPDGGLAGHNTDGDGLLDSLRHDEIALAGRRIVLLGAGGAGRSIAEAFGRSDAGELVVINRDNEKAVTAAKLAPGIGRVGSAQDLADADIIVNATSVGMGSSNAFPFDPSVLGPNQVVVDLIYKPLLTPLLHAATERGCRSFDGLGMLVFQAARQFSLFTGQEAPIATMLAAARSAIQ